MKRLSAGLLPFLPGPIVIGFILDRTSTSSLAFLLELYTQTDVAFAVFLFPASASYEESA